MFLVNILAENGPARSHSSQKKRACQLLAHTAKQTKGKMLGISVGLKVFADLDGNKPHVFLMAVTVGAPSAQLSEDPQ